MLETTFENEFKLMCAVKNCKYFKIPDAKITKSNRYIHKENKRPFDGIFVSSTNIINIEFKIESRAAKPHQLKNLSDSNRIKPNSGLIIRAFKNYIRIDIPYATGFTYSYNTQKVKNIIELITFLKNI